MIALCAHLVGCACSVVCVCVCVVCHTFGGVVRHGECCEANEVGRRGCYRVSFTMTVITAEKESILHLKNGAKSALQIGTLGILF